MPNNPQTLMEAMAYFSDEDDAHAYLVAMRWPEQVCCPRCGSIKVGHLANQKRWKCKDCAEKKQFSVRTGTIFEESPVPLGKWLVAIWLIVNAKNGVSSYEVARSIKVTQKTAWSMMHRIRFALHHGSIDRQLDGRVEADETYIGAEARRMNRKQRVKRRKEFNVTSPKTIVMGLLERGGEIRTKIVPNAGSKALQETVRQHVKPGAELLTDDAGAYRGLKRDYLHQTVNHALTYAVGHVHTNGLENFWSLLKRALQGTYVCVEPFHLFRYLDEQCFRFNNREGTDGERFRCALGGVEGKRLKIANLTGASGAEPVSS